MVGPTAHRVMLGERIRIHSTPHSGVACGANAHPWGGAGEYGVRTHCKPSWSLVEYYGITAPNSGTDTCGTTAHPRGAARAITEPQHIEARCGVQWKYCKQLQCCTRAFCTHLVVRRRLRSPAHHYDGVAWLDVVAQPRGAGCRGSAAHNLVLHAGPLHALVEPYKPLQTPCTSFWWSHVDSQHTSGCCTRQRNHCSLPG